VHTVENEYPQNYTNKIWTIPFPKITPGKTMYDATYDVEKT